MLRVTVLCVAVVASACTTLRPSGISSAGLSSLVAEGGLISPGARVQLVTADESIHEFRVERIDVANGLIIGRDEVVRVADVVEVATRQFAPGKTVALGLGLALGVSAVVVVGTAPAAILSAGAL
jgi:hypothetical protein